MDNRTIESDYREDSIVQEKPKRDHTQDDRPLGRVPFVLLWTFAYGVALVCSYIGMFLLYDFFVLLMGNDNLFSYLLNEQLWVIGIGLGLGMGTLLALIQTWIIRRRYGFVPQYWRAITVLGVTVLTTATLTLVSSMDNGDSMIAILSLVALPAGGIGLIQTIASYRTSRYSLMFLAVSLVATLTATAIVSVSDMYVFFALLAILIIYTFGSALVILQVMAHPRAGAIPKRDASQQVARPQGLHPITFISLWSLTYIVAGGILGILFILASFPEVYSVARPYLDWIVQNDIAWLIGAPIGIVLGIVSASGQQWLMRYYNDTQVTGWSPLSVMGWLLAGIALFHLTIYPDTNYSLWIAAFLIIPSLFQTIAWWLHGERRAWLWTGSSLVTAFVIANLTTDNQTFYAAVGGMALKSILLASTFIFLQNQSQAAKRRSAQEDATQTAALQTLMEPASTPESDIRQSAHVKAAPLPPR